MGTRPEVLTVAEKIRDPVALIRNVEQFSLSCAIFDQSQVFQFFDGRPPLRFASCAATDKVPAVCLNVGTVHRAKTHDRTMLIFGCFDKKLTSRISHYRDSCSRAEPYINARNFGNWPGNRREVTDLLCKLPRKLKPKLA